MDKDRRVMSLQELKIKILSLNILEYFAPQHKVSEQLREIISGPKHAFFIENHRK